MLELHNITKVYNPGTITEMSLFQDFNLKVSDGEFVAIVGSNGSGKTSMLNIICGSIPVEGGDILIDGKRVNGLSEFKRYRAMGRIFQNPAVSTCPDLTLLENMSLADNKGTRFGLQPGISRKRIEVLPRAARRPAPRAGGQAQRPLGAFSGGQRQAVALVMATMSPLTFLILDEHTAALDPSTADRIMELTDRVIRENKLTALMVTHNLRYAVEYGSRILMMDKGQIVLDKSGAEKAATSVNDLLGIFNQISIECGN